MTTKCIFRVLSGAIVGLAIGGHVSAATNSLAGPVTLFIDDRDIGGIETISATALSAAFLSAGGTLSITQEGTGILGLVDYSFEFISTDPNVPTPGGVVVHNYNFFDPITGALSDTLNITLTGHTPAFQGDANVSVDLHFRSDSLNDIPPTSLVNGVAVTETGNFQLFNTGLTDFQVFAGSEVPETSQTLPGIAALAFGIGGFKYYRSRRASKLAATAATEVAATTQPADSAE